MCPPGIHRGQKRAPGSLILELWMAVNHFKVDGGLQTEPRSSRRASALNH